LFASDDRAVLEFGAYRGGVRTVDAVGGPDDGRSAERAVELQFDTTINGTADIDRVRQTSRSIIRTGRAGCARKVALGRGSQIRAVEVDPGVRRPRAPEPLFETEVETGRSIGPQVRVADADVAVGVG